MEFKSQRNSSACIVVPSIASESTLSDNMYKSLAILLIVGVLALSFIPADVDGSITKSEMARVKRGHHYGHGHGPGAGGGAAGPVYFCGWVGKGEGSRGYGHGK